MANRRSLIDLLQERVVFGDGAMGTMLYDSGVFVNACFDELNLSRPDLVKQVHESYVSVGVDFIETNSFGANEIKLLRFGLGDKVEVINRAAVAVARSAAGDEIMVAGAIGPLGQELPPYGSFPVETARKIYLQQAEALAGAGIDFFILETFSNVDELELAVKAAHQAGPNLPIVAQLTVNQHHETQYGRQLESAVGQLGKLDEIAVIGLNCSIGPSAMLGSLERIRNLTDKPVSVQPNAGLPQEVEGRKLYMCTPEYMAEYGKRFFEKGARIIGGCCGTTPAHIKEIIANVRSLDKAVAAKPTISVKRAKGAEKSVGQEPIRLSEKSKIGGKLAAREKITTIEITPPRGYDLTAILEKARLCADQGIDAINIPDGPRASSRLSPMVTAVKIQQTAEIEAILHVCCRDRNLIGMQSDMLGAYAMDLKNMLLITGDPPKLGEYPDATAVFDLDSVGLTTVVDNLNRGVDIANNPFSPPLGLTIGVGANPVAGDLEREIERFKRKVDAGAEYAITQPVFDVQMLLDFIDATKSHPISMVAGIWPFTSFKNAEFMANEVPGVVVPKAILQRMSKAKTQEQGRKLGIEIAREMIEAISDHVGGFAVSAPFGNVKIALAVLGKISPEEI